MRFSKDVSANTCKGRKMILKLRVSRCSQKISEKFRILFYEEISKANSKFL
jgi:hypothetical protein